MDLTDGQKDTQINTYMDKKKDEQKERQIANMLVRKIAESMERRKIKHTM